jgi:hypothetical protein
VQTRRAMLAPALRGKHANQDPACPTQTDKPVFSKPTRHRSGSREASPAPAKLTRPTPPPHSTREQRCKRGVPCLHRLCGASMPTKIPPLRHKQTSPSSASQPATVAEAVRLPKTPAKLTRPTPPPHSTREQRCKRGVPCLHRLCGASMPTRIPPVRHKQTSPSSASQPATVAEAVRLPQPPPRSPALPTLNPYRQTHSHSAAHGRNPRSPPLGSHPETSGKAGAAAPPDPSSPAPPAAMTAAQ